MFPPIDPARIPLIQSPTPLHRLDRLSRELDIDLWIKRDDLTGFAFGGNKGRKLEYLIADVLANKADVVVTCGSAQSNFIRQLGAACSRFDIHCAAAVMDLPFENIRPDITPRSTHGGNVQLDRILGIDLRVLPDDTWDSLYEQAETLAKEFELAGKCVYRIPIGGSSALGAFAFYQAADEVSKQADPFDTILFASSSGSTHSGLQFAFQNSPTQILGIACDPEPEIAEDFAKLATKLAELLVEPPKLTPEDFRLDFRFVGQGYGIPSDAGNAAIERLARSEGIFLDPIYSGKAFAGLLQLVQEGSLHGRVLFWHTGGTPALFTD